MGNNETLDDDKNPTNFKLIYHPHVQLESIISHNNNNTGSDCTTVHLLLRNVKEPNSGKIKFPFSPVGDDKDKVIEIENVNTIIANVGYRPDSSIYEELQVHQCYASEG